MPGNGLLDLAEVLELTGAPADAVSVRGRPRPPLALTLDREAFLVAVAGNTMSSAAANALATQRLNADLPADPDA